MIAMDKLGCRVDQIQWQRSAPEGTDGGGGRVGQQDGDGAVQAEGRVVLVLEDVQVVEPEGLRLDALACTWPPG